MIDDALIHEVANACGLPFDLLKGQVLTESGGDPNAFRYEHGFFDRYILGKSAAKGAAYGPLAACSYGALQIMLETALEMGFTDRPEDLFDPRVGMTWGARKMAALWKWAGGLDSDYPRALSAYNGGTGTAVGPPYPNQVYVNKVYRLAGRTM